MAQFVAAIDQGTTSTRCMIFDHSGHVVAVEQHEHTQIFPQAGWVEHDPIEIWDNVRNVTAGALANADLTAADIASVGITNQRETAVVWERATGKPVYNAIVWQDTRTDRICTALAGEDGPRKYTEVTGLPLATYFSGPPKVKWILDNVEGASEKAEAGELCFGTMDTWVLWNMTGGVDGGVHATDPTNASRTLLMDLDTLAWDSAICADMGIPRIDAPPRFAARPKLSDSCANAERCPACRSPESSAISKQRLSVRPASRPEKRRTPTEPATSCSSTPAPKR